MLRDLNLSWEEVECFVRPQCVLADNIGSGLGSRLLFLVALYRANGYKGYFQGMPDGYFGFCDEVLSMRLPISFRRYRFDDVREGFEFLRSRSADAEPMLVPANIRDLYYYEGYLRKDWAHYFIVDGFDAERRLFQMRDNLHLSMDSRSTDYTSFVLPEDTLRETMASFQRSHLSDGHLHAEAYNRFGRYWLMSLDTDGEAASNDEVAAGIIADYLHYAEQLSDRRCDQEVWHLGEAMASGRAQETRFLLMASNQRGLYIKLLLKAFEEMWPKQQREIQQRVIELLATKNARQTASLVRLHRRDIPDANVASELLKGLQQVLMDLDEALVRHARTLY